jgi:ABC-2 type transport system ATP-binding protein
MEHDPSDVTAAAPATPVVAIRSLRKILSRRVVALDGVDLTVGAGQAMGLAGPNGAGKSTLLKVLLGLVRPTSGSAELFGEPVRPGGSVLSRVGALVDGPGFLPYLTGRKNLGLALRSAGGTMSDEDFDRALAGSGLGSALDRPYRTYSHGMRYRLGLAQAMMGHPDLLILDEPTTGLDPGHVAEVVSSIKAATAAGTTVLLSSHQLPFIERVCTHAAVMHDGRIAADGSLADLIGPSGSLELAYQQAVANRTERTLADDDLPETTADS